MKFAIIFFVFVAAASAVTNYGNCIYDGYYKCQDPIIYNWEEPTSAATAYSPNYNYANPITPPFAVAPFGSAPHPTFSYDSDCALRSYSADNSKVWAFAAMYSCQFSSNSKQYYEVKGAAPNRRIVLTWKDFSNYGNDAITVQLKIFENGNYEVHTQKYVKTTNDYMLNGIEYLDYTASPYVEEIDFNIYDNVQRNYTGYAMGFYVTNQPVTAVCGNSIVEAGEDCDGGGCCSTTCKFKTASTVCRAVNGACDSAEVCSGSSADCPTDAFLPATTSCPEDFGVCDVRTARKCSGNSASCSGFSIPSIDGSSVHWLAYSVISFQDFAADTGSVGGRLAVRRNVAVTGGFSVGDEVTISLTNLNPSSPIVPATYSFIAGGNVAWTNGQIYPAPGQSLRPEEGYAGGSFNGDAQLQERFTKINGGNLDAVFNDAKAHYTAISNNLAAETANAKVESKWGGLFFTCNDQSKRYVVTIDSAVLDAATWYSVDDSTCPFGSAWIINLGGSGAVNFQGGDFPGIGERMVFNVLGSGRTVNVNSRVNANILAPQHTVNQNGGVTAALVIAGDIPKFSSGTNPSCKDLQPFSFVLYNVQASLKGTNQINLASFSISRPDDTLTFGSKSYKIAQKINNNGDVSIVLDRALEDDIPQGTLLKVAVDPNQARAADNVTVQQNSASTLIASFAIFVVALLF